VLISCPQPQSPTLGVTLLRSIVIVNMGINFNVLYLEDSCSIKTCNYYMILNLIPYMLRSISIHWSTENNSKHKKQLNPIEVPIIPNITCS
jgi:hypothetical protein